MFGRTSRKPKEKPSLPISIAGHLYSFLLFAALFWSAYDVVENTLLIRANPTLSAAQINTAAASPSLYPLHLTNAPHPSAPNVQVIGVQHLPVLFKNFSGEILPAIDAADVVLLERGDGYFDAVAEYAKNKGKHVYYVDMSSNNLFNGIATLAPMFALAISVIIKPRRWTHIVFLYLQFAIFFPATFPNPATEFIDNHAGFPLSRYYSSSWIAEGRTLAMSDRAVEFAAGRKAVLIQGDWHARGIFWYHDHPNAERFQRFYQTALWWWAPSASNEDLGAPTLLNSDATRR